MLKLEQDEANFKYHGKAGNITDLTFGQKLRQLRRKAGLTQEEFAEAAACSADHITKMERGSRLPSSRLLRALVQSLENLGIERESLDTLESLLLDYKLTPPKPRPLVEDEVLIESTPPTEIIPDPITPCQSKIPRLYAAGQHSPALGREAQLQQILNFYRSNQGSQLVAITGLGGIGKTTLAFETAERAINQNLFEQVIWESAKTLKPFTPARLRKSNIPPPG